MIENRGVVLISQWWPLLGAVLRAKTCFDEKISVFFLWCWNISSVVIILSVLCCQSGNPKDIIFHLTPVRMSPAHVSPDPSSSSSASSDVSSSPVLFPKLGGTQDDDRTSFFADFGFFLMGVVEMWMCTGEPEKKIALESCVLFVWNTFSGQTWHPGSSRTQTHYH